MRQDGGIGSKCRWDKTVRQDRETRRWGRGKASVGQDGEARRWGRVKVSVGKDGEARRRGKTVGQGQSVGGTRW